MVFDQNCFFIIVNGLSFNINLTKSIKLVYSITSSTRHLMYSKYVEKNTTIKMYGY